MERLNFILEKIVKEYLQKLEKEKADEEFFENILREGALCMESNVDLKNRSGNVVFQKAPQEEERVSIIPTSMDFSMVLAEILGILPIVLAVVIGLLALRKAIQLLLTTLRQG